MTNLGLSALIDLKRFDFTKTKSDNPCHIVINPPYWKRIEGQNKDSVEEFYKAIGDTLKKIQRSLLGYLQEICKH
jgi:23S rRNA G2445 N2-methylase RlmL